MCRQMKGTCLTSDSFGGPCILLDHLVGNVILIDIADVGNSFGSYFFGRNKLDIIESDVGIISLGFRLLSEFGDAVRTGVV